jgi:hypothetical protein
MAGQQGLTQIEPFRHVTFGDFLFNIRCLNRIRAGCRVTFRAEGVRVHWGTRWRETSEREGEPESIPNRWQENRV